MSHMRFIGGVVYCPVKKGRVSLGADHRYADGFRCPACKQVVPPLKIGRS